MFGVRDLEVAAGGSVLGEDGEAVVGAGLGTEHVVAQAAIAAVRVVVVQHLA